VYYLGGSVVEVVAEDALDVAVLHQLHRPLHVVPLPSLKGYKVGFNQDNFTFALMLITKIVLCSKFH